MDLRVAFALRATDNAGNVAEVSNIAMMNLFLFHCYNIWSKSLLACKDDNKVVYVNTELLQIEFNNSYRAITTVYIDFIEVYLNNYI